MKIKLSTILLLLSFVVLLSHQIIPHHHHEDVVDEILSNSEPKHEHSHHNGDKHQHDSPDNSKQDNPVKSQHDHDFPKHFHGTVTSDIPFTQQSQSKLSKQIQQTVTIILFGTYTNELYKPPEIKYVDYNLLFKITSLFEPGAIALRGPPSIV